MSELPLLRGVADDNPLTRNFMPVPKAVILVVEDEALIRMGAVDLVRAAGFEALEASNAAHALVILESRPDIHLVFTDIEMPGTMDGIKLAHYVRNRWPSLKLIVASGKAIVEESQLPVGARFFSKPYRDDTIVGALMELLPGQGSGA